MLYQICDYVIEHTLKMYYSFMYSNVNYGITVWGIGVARGGARATPNQNTTNDKKL